MILMLKGNIKLTKKDRVNFTNGGIGGNVFPLNSI